MVHEDAHVLAVAKPAGVTTHRADTHTQDGMHEWVQRQRPGVALSVLHRLDKATSGVLVFGKSRDANRMLAAQLEGRTVAKDYDLLAAPGVDGASHLRSDRRIDGAEAATDLILQESGPGARRYRARPHTGRTHQVRIHAQALGLPVLGDGAHGGPPAVRLFLHAARFGADGPDGRLRLGVDRPRSFGEVVAGRAAPDGAGLAARVAHEARAVLFDPADTDAYLWIDRHHDGFPGLRVERLGDVALVHDHRDDTTGLAGDELDALAGAWDLKGTYVQPHPRGGGGPTATRVAGAAPPRFEVVELGLRYEVDLEASATSSGLFLDQRETRRELLSADLSRATVLNVFAHTGSLSVAAARAGAETLTLDLSRRYLDRARDNLRRNGIDPDDHDFIYGDALEWMDRLARKGRRFDLVLADPPSASTPRRKGARRWSVDRDLHVLVARAARLCTEDGRVFVSTNSRRMTWARFLDHVGRGLDAAGRIGSIATRTLPLDHRSGPGDHPYLKAAWVDLDR